MTAQALADNPFTRHRGTDGQDDKVRINPGGYYVTSGREILVTVLGSCVAACIRDPLASVGGMNHFMLPQSESGTWGIASATMRFGNFAMEQLINEILCRGGRRLNLEIKVFGGAGIIGSSAQVGSRNADFVETYLQEEGLPIAAKSLRGLHARRIHYQPLTGRVRMLEMPRAERAVDKIERSYVDRLRAEPEAGSIELFD
jgi:chemotaxis protein CheD